MSKTETISIERVDTAELERQRLALGAISQLTYRTAATTCTTVRYQS